MMKKFDIKYYQTKRVLFLVMVLWGILSFSQIKITGQVLDDLGETVPEVTIYNEGAEVGVSDLDGNFEFDLPSGMYSLSFESDFYDDHKEEVRVDNTPINLVVTLGSDESNQLDEVVAIGYGTRKIKDATGAVANLKPDEANSGGSSTSVDQMLSGRVAGVQFKQNSSQPGGGGKTIIRGRNSIFGTTDPLYVIDGIPINNTANSASSGAGFGAPDRNPLNSINPNDIENISVLKDAAATAIYGARGANGVIIITTKRGKKGEMKISYDTYTGWQDITRKYDLMNSSQYQNFWDLADGEINTSINTDWQDEVTRTGSIQSHNVTFSGANENFRYYVSGGYFKQDGVLKNSGLERFNGRTNLEFKKDRLTINTNFFGSLIKDKNQASEGGSRNSLIASAITFGPYLQPGVGTEYITDPASSFNIYPNSLLWILDRTNTDQLNANLGVKYETDIGLTPELKFGYEVQNSSNKFWVPNSAPLNGSASVGNHGGYAVNTDTRNDNRLVEALLHYDKVLGEKHNINAVVGYSYQDFDYELNRLIGSDFPLSILVGNDNMVVASTQQTESDKQSNTLISGFGRLDYTYDDKYTVSATLRRDGSSKFAEGNKWKWFPGVSASWKLSNETFLEDSKTISFLKLRAGYGLVGNQGFDNYLSLALFDVSNDGILGQGSVGGTVITDYKSNPNLEWETTSQLNFGTDYGLFNNRITGTMDLYFKRTNDLIIPVPLISESGQDVQWLNAADTKTTGFEFSINSKNIDNENFRWNTNLNFSTLKTKVDDILIDGDAVASTLAELGFVNGEVANAYYTHKFTGLDDQGRFTFEDVDGNGVIDDNDRQIIGSPDPNFTIGLGNDFKYGSWSLGFYFNGAFGQELFNGTAAEYTVANTGQRTNLLEDAISFTSSNGTHAQRVSASGGNWYYNSRWIEDAWFIKLQNISLSYDFDTQKLLKGILSSFKIYFQAQNLFTITDYSGTNPEAGNTSYIDRGENNPPFLPGKIDASAYPPSRTYSVGVNVSF